MSVFSVMAKMKNYIENCPTVDMKEAAREDFKAAVDEVIKVGYTWGRQHQLPFEINTSRKLGPFEFKNLEIVDLNLFFLINLK